ncbi:probable serine threonine- kinase gdt4 [Paramuricea clavata]|uniref:Probable serine threonine- kinase gdt4 n=1 Tax=Paramuricea clavata TaxID=317549 RepID=A0A7D9IZN6_PARCT|nr:probable serine threonine- kinase gdt4 [Paramuricea clavata]
MEGKSVGERCSKANTPGIFVSSLSQANAFQAECSLADRASGLPLADVRLIQKQESMRVVDEHIRNNEMYGKHKQSIKAIRRKRLRRNKKKKESLKFTKQARKEKRSRVNQTIEELQIKLQRLTDERIQGQVSHEQPDHWRNKLYDQEKAKKSTIYRAPKNLNRNNLKSLNCTAADAFLGKGTFGTCTKMLYRDLEVAVKSYQENVTRNCVQWEASIINLFDHPGLPLLFGYCLEVKPFLMVMQFHGIDGNSTTLQQVSKSGMLLDIVEWHRIFYEVADILLCVHKKSFLHNDIKADNILITKRNKCIHPILIDFGKCRRVSQAKWYKLDKKQQEKYFKNHWHLAPELILGTHCQSFASDVFSLGIMLSTIYKALQLKCKVLKTIYRNSVSPNPASRILVKDILRQLKHD